MEERLCTELEAAAFRRLLGHLRERRFKRPLPRSPNLSRHRPRAREADPGARKPRSTIRLLVRMIPFLRLSLPYSYLFPGNFKINY
jgi:hypothetical protein